MDLFSQLSEELKKNNAEYRVVSAERLNELKADYLKYINASKDKKFLQKYINDYIDFSVLDKFPSIQSFVIVATKSPQIDVKFIFNENEYLLSIPPTYTDRKKVTGKIKEITAQVFDQNGYHTFPVVLPKKYLAVRSGLAKYGKNNVTYVPGFGSYHRLTAFATDYPCEQDTWQETQVLDRCSICKACQKTCPTHAIEADRFVIDADRCLTFYNEQPGEFPEWIDPKSHNSIIGCIPCQHFCPENLKVKSTTLFEDEFTSSETNLILDEKPFEDLPQTLKEKITKLDITYCYPRLSRNIRTLIENKSNNVSLLRIS